MRLSAYFLPLIKENPTEAQIVSHRLMQIGRASWRVRV